MTISWTQASRLLVSAGAVLLAACQLDILPIAIDGDDIAGVVRSAAGAEAGVWVIAETDDFDTLFARVVVTDEDGRYLVPDLHVRKVRKT